MSLLKKQEGRRTTMIARPLFEAEPDDDCVYTCWPAKEEKAAMKRARENGSWCNVLKKQ